MNTISDDSRKRWTDGMTCLSRVLPAIADDFTGQQFRLSVRMLATEAATVIDSASARSIKGLVFALDDLTGIAGELSGDDRSQLEGCLELLRNEATQWQSEFSLSQATAGRLRAFRGKLTERRAAREKQLYLPPGSPLAALPHEPRALQAEAVALQGEVAAAGFESAALARLAADPASFEIRDVTELIEEISAVLE